MLARSFRKRAAWVGVLIPTVLATGALIALTPAVGVGILAVIIAAVYLFLHPFHGLVLIGFLIPFRVHVVSIPDSSISFTLTQLLTLLLVVIVIVRAGVNQTQLRKVPYLESVALIFGLLALSSNRGGYWYGAARGFFKWGVSVALYCLVVWLTDDTDRLEALVKAMIAAGLVQGLIGMRQVFLSPQQAHNLLGGVFGRLFFDPDRLVSTLWVQDTNWLHGNRVGAFGTFMNSIGYSIYMASISSFVLGLTCVDVRRARRRRQILLVVVVLAGVIAFKRTGWVALLAGLGTAYLALILKTGRLNGRVLAGLAVVCLVVAILLTGTGLAETVTARALDLWRPDPYARPAVWRYYAYLSRTALWLGYGFASPAHARMPRQTYVRGEPVTVSVPTENSYLEMALAGGWVCVAILLMVVAATYRGLVGQIWSWGHKASEGRASLLTGRWVGSTAPLAMGVLGGLTSLLVGAMFIAAFGGGPLLQLLWVLIGIAVSMDLNGHLVASEGTNSDTNEH